MFEDMVLRMVFGPKSEEFTGELRKFLSQELRVWTLCLIVVGDYIQDDDRRKMH